MARVAQVNLVDLDVIDGVGVASYKLKVLRTGATSPSNPIDDVDEFSFTVPVGSLDTMDDAMIAACLSAAASTGLLEAEIITKGRPKNPWLSPPGGGSGADTMCVQWHGDASANFALTNLTLAEQFPVSQPQRLVKMVDLTGMNYVRMAGYVSVGSNLAASKVMLKYKTGAYSATVGQYSAIGTSAVEVSLQSIAAVDTGWITLAEAAKAVVQVGITGQGGDGVVDPAFGHLNVFFKA